MTLTIFKAQIQKLNEKIIKMTEDDPFIDGPLNEEEYYYSRPYRILWLMKEAYGEPISYPKFYQNEYSKFYKELIMGPRPSSWVPVVYITYSIFNNFKTWEQMEYIENDPEMVKILSKVAWININKLPSLTGSHSPYLNIKIASEKYNEILQEQIKLLKPNIVICGNTFEFLKKDLGFPKECKYNSEELFVPHYNINNTLYIDPYHPGCTHRGSIGIGLYINDIIRTIKKYFASVPLVYEKI